MVRLLTSMFLDAWWYEYIKAFFMHFQTQNLMIVQISADNSNFIQTSQGKLH